MSVRLDLHKARPLDDAVFEMCAELARPRVPATRVSGAILEELPAGRRPSGRHLFRDDGYEVDVPYYLSTGSEIDAGAEEVYLAPPTEWNVVSVTDGLVSAIAREILDARRLKEAL